MCTRATSESRRPFHGRSPATRQDIRLVRAWRSTLVQDFRFAINGRTIGRYKMSARRNFSKSVARVVRHHLNTFLKYIFKNYCSKKKQCSHIISLSFTLPTSLRGLAPHTSRAKFVGDSGNCEAIVRLTLIVQIWRCIVDKNVVASICYENNISIPPEL